MENFSLLASFFLALSCFPQPGCPAPYLPVENRIDIYTFWFHAQYFDLKWHNQSFLMVGLKITKLTTLAMNLKYYADFLLFSLVCMFTLSFKRFVVLHVYVVCRTIWQQAKFTFKVCHTFCFTVVFVVEYFFPPLHCWQNIIVLVDPVRHTTRLLLHIFTVTITTTTTTFAAAAAKDCYCFCEAVVNWWYYILSFVFTRLTSHNTKNTIYKWVILYAFLLCTLHLFWKVNYWVG